MDATFLEINRTLLLFATTLLTIWVIFKWMEYREFPPGPFGLPIIGYLPFWTRRSINKILADLEKRYGSIFSWKYGSSSYVVLADYEAAKQVVSHPGTFARPDSLLHVEPAKAGFLLAEGDKWLNERAVVVNGLKQAISNGNWNTIIQDNVDEFIAEMKSWTGKPVNYRKSLGRFYNRSFLSLTIGRSLTEGLSPSDVEICERYNYELYSQVRPDSFILCVPEFAVRVLRSLRVPFVKKKFETVENFHYFARRQIQKIMDSPSLLEENSIASHYLNESTRLTDSVKYLSSSTDILLGGMTSLQAAVYTANVSLYWLLLTAACHPEVQRKVHLEIDRVAGRNRRICWSEKKSFPYTMATIYEIKRWITATPFSALRKARETLKLSNYIIPKGSNIFVNFWSMARNQQLHKNAELFKPERFLNAEETQIGNMDNYFPFSFGKRQCPGKEATIRSTFLYFTSIMQKFRLVSPVGTSVHFDPCRCIYEQLGTDQDLCFMRRDE